METQPIRIGKWTLRKIREIGKDFGSPADDAIMRQIIEGYERRGIEIELLQQKLKECENR